ncbi:metal ABC transporter, periplasmic metal-binding protein [Syntrophotalea carbinolica DSM 2380]|uniref:Metal ABC transporter, periplasmic metal-binding protein n=1 Tax=Syntrophotalea carbinolica (strain DSM 2380 / NBRC 103641 / GraBd1) TaxID=338963 RepID=Q3A046_SYNC1|nr:zinc ABC transporter substrate-binding protein [Syntrophotalea carbinolica]ABA90261.1 metal ABC transporter, periplasmic metal-binding protein [Syntrophotalea carbinolica DSM 2380]
MTRWTLVLIVLLSLFPVATTAYAIESGGRPVQVFVSVLPLKYFVERVGGAHVITEVMVGPGQSPATYEPAPRQMSRLGQADLYFRVGVPFERVWMPRLVDLNQRMRIVDLRDGVDVRRLEQHHHDDDHDTKGAAVTHRDNHRDPHIWTSPIAARIIAEHIRAALTAFDPSHARDYQAGYASLAADLTRLDSELHNRLDRVAHRKFLVFHPSWGYFADAYGLQQIAIEAEGKEPGPRALAGIIAMARKKNIRVIFVQQQFSRATATTVARAIGGKVVAIDPLAENYIENLRKAADAFFTVLEK